MGKSHSTYVHVCVCVGCVCVCVTCGLTCLRHWRHGLYPKVDEDVHLAANTSWEKRVVVGGGGGGGEDTTHMHTFPYALMELNQFKGSFNDIREGEM